MVIDKKLPLILKKVDIQYLFASSPEYHKSIMEDLATLNTKWSAVYVVILLGAGDKCVGPSVAQTIWWIYLLITIHAAVDHEDGAMFYLRDILTGCVLAGSNSK